MVAPLANHDWSNGVYFSHGNLALRHPGIPTVAVAMGIMSDIGMPVGATFAAAPYADLELLRFAAAYEAGGSGFLRRPAPIQQGTLAGDVVHQR